MRALCALLTALVAALLPWRAEAAFSVPALRGPVNDYAHLLSPADSERLTQALQRLWQGGGSQVAVLTIPDLGGEVLEQASIKVVDQWKLGKAKVDNGVLLFISAAEHKIRIEVGQGLEGVLPDAYARRIVSDTMVPLFRANKASTGIVAGVSGIVARTDPDVHFDLGQVSAAPVAGDSGSRGTSIPFGFFVILVVVLILYSRFGRGGGGPWIGGDFGGGGGRSRGGGDFSGGGGGFSGGGASDEW